MLFSAKNKEPPKEDNLQRTNSSSPYCPLFRGSTVYLIYFTLQDSSYNINYLNLHRGSLTSMLSVDAFMTGMKSMFGRNTL